MEGYTVSQAVEATGIKSHVLRYWEEELHLSIRRNKFGHRYYTEQDIQLFLNIQKLKEKGLQLKGIKDALPKLEEMTIPVLEEKDLKEMLPVSEKFEKFQNIMERLIEAELHMRNPEESRYRFLDQSIRRLQAVRKEIAATKEDKKKENKHGKRVLR